MHRGHTQTRKSQAVPPMREPSRAASCQFSFLGALAEHIGEKRARVNAMRGVVRTSINAAWFFQVRAEIARSRFLLDRCFLVSGPPRFVNHHFEWVQINIAVRAILRAKAAANAPIFDDDFERIAPSNRADGAADHAERVAALPATRRHKILVESQAVAHKTR